MKFYLLIFIILIYSIFPALSQPKLFIPTGHEYNFGDVGPGELHCKIPIINIGKDTLKIRDVQTSCGCTTAPIDKKVLGSGDTAILYVLLNAKNGKGAKGSLIRLKTNSITDSLDTIKLKANVICDLTLSDQYFKVSDNIQLNKEFISEVEITNSGKEVVMIMPPVFEGQDLKIHFNLIKDKILKPEEKIKIKAFITSSQNNQFGTVYIPTSSKYMPIIDIKLNVHISDTANNINKN